MSNEMPRFNFSNSSIKSDEQFTTEGHDERKFKQLQPGRYDATIAAVEYTGQAKDPNWGNMMAVYATADGREIRDYFLIPFSDHLYGEKRTSFPFNKLKKLCAALGYELTIANTADVMKALFAKPEKLVSTPVTIEVGYESGFIHYAGKNTDGARKYQIFGADKNPVRNVATMTPMEFPDQLAAVAYAKENNISVDRFPRVLQVQRSAALKTTSVAKDTW